MIRGLGIETILTYSQTLNGCELQVVLINLWLNNYFKWAVFGKQNWRCGMHQTYG